MPRVYAGQVTSADLGSLLEELQAELRFAYLESVTESRWVPYEPALVLDDALRGRIFGPHCDVQFARTGDGVRVTVLTDSVRPAMLAGPTLDLNAHDAEETTYVLWGRYGTAADAWTESGLPRRWRYPLEGHPSCVGVHATEYRDRASGDLQFVRYGDLVPLEEAL